MTLSAEQHRAIADALAMERSRTGERIRSLTRDFDDIVERSGDAARDDEHDPEGNTIAFERAQVSALLTAARIHLGDIELADQRLASATHDRCERCGGPIPFERLSARPTARTCISCLSG